MLSNRPCSVCSISNSNAAAVTIPKSRLPRDLDMSLMRALGHRAAEGTEPGRAAEPWDTSEHNSERSQKVKKTIKYYTVMK